MSPSAKTHRPDVHVIPGRYPYRPGCSCGWSTRGYAARHAAQDVADAHAEDAIADAAAELATDPEGPLPSWAMAYQR